MKKGLDLGGMIDTAATPKETGIPQRGARPRKVKAERRSDRMSVRMKPSTRALIESLAEDEGEFTMVKATAQNGWIDEERMMMESLMGFKRAECDGVLTYFTPAAAKLLNG